MKISTKITVRLSIHFSPKTLRRVFTPGLEHRARSLDRTLDRKNLQTVGIQETTRIFYPDINIYFNL